MRPIWPEHPSRDIQRFISQPANAAAQQAGIRQAQNWTGAITHQANDWRPTANIRQGQRRDSRPVTRRY